MLSADIDIALMEKEFDFVKLHDHPEQIQSTIKLLNDEWPRNTNARLISLEQSRDSLPISLILIGEDNTLYGHVKLKRNLPSRNSVFLESLVVDRENRGKGLGKLIMNRTESFVKQMGFNEIVLTSIDQVGFYLKLGYEVIDSFESSNFIRKKKDNVNNNFITSNIPQPPPPPPQPNHVPSSNVSQRKTLMHKFI